MAKRDNSVDLTNDMLSTSLYNIRELNSSFALGSLDVMYTGKNRNKTKFKKGNVKKAIPSLFNIPIVCHWDSELGQIGGHDISVEKNDNGDIALINLSEPCGVVPESASVSFSKKEDESGNTHEYLTIDNVILWKRQRVFDHIQNSLGGVVNHSMEIEVLEYEKDTDGYYDIKDFQFTALCLLERDEPCFEGSRLNLYSVECKEHFKQKMDEMLAELKMLTVASSSTDNINQNNAPKGGEQEVKETTLEFTEKLDAETSGAGELPQDEVEVKEGEPVSVVDGSDSPEQDGEQADDINPTEGDDGVDDDSTPPEGFALIGNIARELQNVIRNRNEDLPEGSHEVFCYMDFDADLGLVYCYDWGSGNYYGFPYAVSGDAVSIDFDSGKRVKQTFVDFVDGETPPDAYNGLSEMVEKFSVMTAETESLTRSLEETKDALNVATASLAELEEYKANIEKEKREHERSVLFESFSELSGNEDFEKLKSNSDNYSLDELEDKCFAIAGRIAKFSFNSADDDKSIKIKLGNKSIQDDNVAGEPYGGIFVEFGMGK